MQAADGIFVEVGVDEAAYAASLRRMVASTNAAAARIEAAFGRIGKGDTGGGFATGLERSGERIQAAGFGWGSGLKGIATQMAGFALVMGAAGAGGQALKSMADFEQSINVMAAAAGKTAEEIKPLRQQALQLGQDTALAATDIASAQLALTKLGLTLDEVKSITPAVVNLAVIEGLDPQRAAEIVGAIQMQFRRGAGQATETVDILAQASRISAANVSDLGGAMKYAGVTAQQAGQSIETTAAALVGLSKGGLDGFTAGTSLRQMFSDLIAPSIMARAEMAKYGITVRDSSGRVKDLFDIVEEFRAKGVSNESIFRIFDANSGTGMQVLLQQGAGALRDFRKEMEKADGVAKTMGNATMSGLAGAIEQSKGAWQGLAIALGDAGALEAATDGTRQLAYTLKEMTGIIADLTKGWRDLNQQQRDALAFAAQMGTGLPPEVQREMARRAAQAGADRGGDLGYAGGLFFRPQRAGGGADPNAPPAKPPPQPIILLPADQQAREIAQLKEQVAASREGQAVLERVRAIQAEQNAALSEGLWLTKAEAEARVAARDALQTELTISQSRLDRERAMSEARAAANRQQTAFGLSLERNAREQEALTVAAQHGTEAYERAQIALDLMRQNPFMNAADALDKAEEIRKKLELFDRAKARMNELNDAGRQMGDAVAGAFERMILGGGKFSDVLKALARDILAIAVRTAVTNPLGEALGTVLGGLFSKAPGKAVGGPVAAGGAYRVGERGPELFVPNLPGKIIPSGSAFGGGGMTLIDNRRIDASGADPAAIARLERILAADQATRRQQFMALMNDYRSRRA